MLLDADDNREVTVLMLLTVDTKTRVFRLCLRLLQGGDCLYSCCFFTVVVTNDEERQDGWVYIHLGMLSQPGEVNSHWLLG